MSFASIIILENCLILSKSQGVRVLGAKSLMMCRKTGRLCLFSNTSRCFTGTSCIIHGKCVFMNVVFLNVFGVFFGTCQINHFVCGVQSFQFLAGVVWSPSWWTLHIEFSKELPCIQNSLESI